MCTVSYIPIQNGFYFTSSRDEMITRETLPPRFYSVKGEQLLFPRDSKAGGTWIATSVKGITICLLNGAFENHVKTGKYRQSRGQVVIESFGFNDMQQFYNEFDLSEVEPFTLLVLDYRKKGDTRFNEFIWDGEKKYLRKLDVLLPQIWCSVTLYTKIECSYRKINFNNWLLESNLLNSNEIMDFHNQNFDYLNSRSKLIKEANTLETLNISQVFFKDDVSEIKFHDILSDKIHQFYISKNRIKNA